ncbi:unnamed protein product [Rotaria sp. Silwood2]|nr:unnamed protein product [Rotaria sp. Silwood2]CAF2507589.1 unnamed protein product [Rotaria sp. Silwood2]CAF2738891.1 unnamed protein product [Rotaria sp. Silwood2]CAF2907348.1 unnamed protein product [Rotaria sp. Silwood2]CAF3868587.1 unnamed protein product [Rotaria sp. Silwood2]
MALAVQSVSSLSSAVTTVSTRSSTLRTSRPMTASTNRSMNTKFVVDWNNSSTSSNKTKTNDDNLQEAFCRFREQRMDEIRLQHRVELKRKKKIRRSDPGRMYRLRLKFVEQAKRYLGIPYAKKYFEPGTLEYESKLFLDCCGLVRRVMYDLSKDFGFVVGPWNQSYMFDTLPKTITHLSDVQPGDLVFISATYYNEKMKKQRHNLTHVEIMLGDGEKTIGARWNNGKVQFFDSYKFISKSYHSQIYTIKSIDHWLKGICKSYCSQHSWRRRHPTKLDKKSIFYSPDQPNGGQRRRAHSSKPSKGIIGSSPSSINSSNKKVHHRRKRRRRTKRSKSHKRSSSVKLSSEITNLNPNGEHIPLSTTSDIQSVSDNDILVGGDDDDDDDDDSVEAIGNQLAEMNCQDAQEQCDDSDSLDEALDAECFDDDNGNNFI